MCRGGTRVGALHQQPATHRLQAQGQNTALHGATGCRYGGLFHPPPPPLSLCWLSQAPPWLAHSHRALGCKIRLY